MKYLKYRNNLGFTLIELMVVLGILVTLASLAVPNYIEALPKIRAMGATRELFTDMQFARGKAINDNNDYIIAFNTTNNSYSLYNDKDNSYESASCPLSLDPTELVKTVVIKDKYSGISFGYVPGNAPEGSGTISSSVTFVPECTDLPTAIFRPNGTAKTGTVYIKPDEDTSRKDRERAISVAVTGRVKIWKHDGNSWSQ